MYPLSVLFEVAQITGDLKERRARQLRAVLGGRNATVRPTADRNRAAKCGCTATREKESGRERGTSPARHLCSRFDGGGSDVCCLPLARATRLQVREGKAARALAEHPVRRLNHAGPPRPPQRPRSNSMDRPAMRSSGIAVGKALLFDHSGMEGEDIHHHRSRQWSIVDIA